MTISTHSHYPSHPSSAISTSLKRHSHVLGWSPLAQSFRLSESDTTSFTIFAHWLWTNKLAVVMEDDMLYDKNGDIVMKGQPIATFGSKELRAHSDQYLTRLIRACCLGDVLQAKNFKIVVVNVLIRGLSK